MTGDSRGTPITSSSHGRNSGYMREKRQKVMLLVVDVACICHVNETSKLKSHVTSQLC
jgi:hypothetical protein